jgi:apolipoprotein N-acyltransferase
MKITRPHKTWLLPVASGFLIGTSYIPFPPWASLFCFVPLWIFWFQQKTLRNVFLGGWLCAFIFTLIGFNWVTYLLHEFAHLPWLVAAMGMLLFAAVAHLFVPIAGVLWFIVQQRLQCKKRLSLWIMAMFTILCEFYSLTVFDWNFGYSWYAAELPVYHYAEIIGFSGLSAFTLLANLACYFAWQKHQHYSGRMLLAGIIAVFIFLNLGGIGLKNRLPEPDTSLNMLLVQASIANEEKLAAELGQGYRDEIFNRYKYLTDLGIRAHAKNKIDFAVWPETAFPFLLGEMFEPTPQTLALKDFLKEHQLPLITGSYSLDLNTRHITNSLFVLDKDGEIMPPHYSKTILLAFGEYIPGEDIFPQIREWLPTTGQFARGPGPTLLLNINGFKIGPHICYESLFPGFTRSLSDLGAQFIVNATNDSWYGSWQEPYQHLYMTLARAVEFRRPLLRATNTGISTVVLASGEILEKSPIYEEWVGLYKVPYLKNPQATFYQRWFWLIPALLWFTLSVLLIIAFRTRALSTENT